MANVVATHPGSRGVPVKVVSDTIGHADVSITPSIYGVLPATHGNTDGIYEALGKPRRHRKPPMHPG